MCWGSVLDTAVDTMTTFSLSTGEEQSYYAGNNCCGRKFP